MQSPGSGTSRLNLMAIGACFGLLILFGFLSYSAVLTKSATFDEPMHALAGWIHFYQDDFRINFEDPPLWNDWAALANGPNAIRINKDDPDWIAMRDDLYREWPFTSTTLFKTPGNDGVKFINRARFMMLLLGIALGTVITLWTWKLAGPIAAMIAAALFSLDPNFLAHASLVKNDVPLTLMMAAIFGTCWSVGRRMTLFNVATLCLLTAIAMNTKFSAILIGPMLLITLGLRAFLPAPWSVFGRQISKIGGKTIAATMLLIMIGVTSYLGIWACYGFRFAASNDPSVQPNTGMNQSELLFYRFQAEQPTPIVAPLDLNLPLSKWMQTVAGDLNAFNRALEQAKTATMQPEVPGEARTQILASIYGITSVSGKTIDILNQAKSQVASTDPKDLIVKLHEIDIELAKSRYQLEFLKYQADYSNRPPDTFASAVDFMLEHRLLPSAWLNGILYVHARSTVRGCYLLGEVGQTGWWYYFPLAMIFKMPVGTAGLLIIAVISGVFVLVTRGKNLAFDFLWPAVCLFTPFAIYFGVAMATNLNIGLRHILAVYPFIYVSAAVLLHRAILRWGRCMTICITAFVVVLGAETLFAWPNYIAHFSWLVGGPRHAFYLLADSNLDWGQDLPLLARWQKDHGDVPVALAYSGVVEPSAYGVKCQPLPPGPPDPQISATHILAVGATPLQCIDSDGYKVYQSYKPLAVLGGGTIYLYDFRNSPPTTAP